MEARQQLNPALVQFGGCPQILETLKALSKSRIPKRLDFEWSIETDKSAIIWQEEWKI